MSMKKSAIPPEPSDAWIAALELFAADLRRRGAAERTRHEYAADLRQFATWATAPGVEAAAVTPRVLRRYAASMSEAGLAPTTIARKLAALRSFFRTMREHGDL